MTPFHVLVQNQAARVQVEISAIVAELAALADKADAAAETVSAAIEHHPELQWEQATTALLPKLGAARDLFDKDKRLHDFKWVVQTQSNFMSCVRERP